MPGNCLAACDDLCQGLLFFHRQLPGNSALLWEAIITLGQLSLKSPEPCLFDSYLDWNNGSSMASVHCALGSQDLSSDLDIMAAAGTPEQRHGDGLFDTPTAETHSAVVCNR